MRRYFTLPGFLKIVFLTSVFILTGSELKAENLMVTLNAAEYQFADTDEGELMIRMEDFGYLLVPGKPMLPVKEFLIALPPGAEIISVATQGVGSVELQGTYMIGPAPPLLPASDRLEIMRESREVWQRNYDIVYSSDHLYPADAGWYLGTGALRKYTFARVAFAPFSYHPQSERLVFTPSLAVSIEYASPSLGSHEIRTLLTDTKTDYRASRLFVNYPEAKQWYVPQGMPESPQQPYNYVIITSGGLTTAVDTLVKWKQSLGYTVNVVRTSWIDSNYAGVDLPEKIRNFLIDKYIAWGIEYVLLAGDLDVIPMRRCYPDPLNHGTDLLNCPPTDYYYADLTSNWDWDGDGFPGEYGQDSVDFYAEVYVGRIPHSDASTMVSICEKLVGFESGDHSWKTNALLLGAISNFANEDGLGLPMTDGAVLMQSMITSMLTSWSYTTMYEKTGLSISAFPCTLSLTTTNVVSNWSSNDYGIVNWWSHGSYDVAWRKIWTWDNGDGIPQTQNPQEISLAAPIIWNTDAPSLDNNHPSIVFACACQNGWLRTNSLAKDLLQNGAVGMVAATRDSWYAIGWSGPGLGGNADLDYSFFNYLISYAEKMGEALSDAKIASLPLGSWQGQANLLTFCLYGDPALPLGGLPAHAHIFSTIPTQNELDVSTGTSISVTFDTTIDFSTVNLSSLVVNGQCTGWHTGTFSHDDPPRTVTFTPAVPFTEGELVTVMLTRGIESLDDIALDNSYTWSFTIATGTADAVFDSLVEYPLALSPGSVFAGDLDNDGDLDLTATYRITGGDSVIVLFNNGDGTFPIHFAFPVPVRPKSLTAADFDCDGDLDLAIVCTRDNHYEDSVFVRLNNGSGIFTAHSGCPVGGQADDVFAADLDGDGDLDLAVPNAMTDNVSVLFNDGNGVFVPQPALQYPSGSGPNSVVAADLDGDGYCDLAVTNVSADNLFFHLNNRNGTFAAQIVYAVGDAPAPRSIRAADLDGDGDLDLSTVNAGSDDVSVLLNNGDGTFAPQSVYAVGWAPNGTSVADMDGDGDLDLAVENILDKDISVLLNNGDGTFAPHVDYSIPNYPGSIFAADLDNNNIIDLAITGGNPPTISLLFNQFTPCVCGARGDIDNDGGADPMDVALLVLYVYKSQDFRTYPVNWYCPHDLGDVNCDGGVPNPLDVTYLVNYVFRAQDAICDACNPPPQ